MRPVKPRNGIDAQHQEEMGYVRTYTLNATTLFESLIMQGIDETGKQITQNLNLRISGATWTVNGSVRYGITTGSAEIAY